MLELCVKTVGKVDVGADLLEWCDPLDLVKREVLDWTDESGGECADKDDGVDGVLEMALFHVRDLCLFWDYITLNL